MNEQYTWQLAYHMIWRTLTHTQYTWQLVYHMIRRTPTHTQYTSGLGVATKM